MVTAEPRGPYDISRSKDGLVALDEKGERIAIFLDPAFGRQKNLVSIAVSLPNSAGTRCYSVDFDWLLGHLRRLDPALDVRLDVHT